jgi:hypothetical protein
MTHCLALRPSGAAQSMSTHLKERRAYSKATTKTGAVSGRLAGFGFFVIVAFSTSTQSTRPLPWRRRAALETGRRTLPLDNGPGQLKYQHG